MPPPPTSTIIWSWELPAPSLQLAAAAAAWNFNGKVKFLLKRRHQQKLLQLRQQLAGSWQLQVGFDFTWGGAGKIDSDVETPSQCSSSSPQSNVCLLFSV